MQDFLLFSCGMVLLFVLEDYLRRILSYICDQIIGPVIEAFGKWIAPVLATLTGTMARIMSRLSVAHVIGSMFLFSVTVLLCTANYWIIYYAMELLLPVEESAVTGSSLTPAGVLSLVIMIAEILIGFLLLEVIGLTNLFEWKTKMNKRTRLIIGTLLLIIFLVIISAEVGAALNRLYQTEEEDLASLQNMDIHTRFSSQPIYIWQTSPPWSQSRGKFESFARKLPRFITGFFAFVIPVLAALSAFSLEDVLLLVGLLIILLLVIPLYFLQVIYSIVYQTITKIDDFLGTIISFITWPVNIVVSIMLYILVVLHMIKVP